MSHIFTRVHFSVLFFILFLAGLNQAKAQRTFANTQSSATSGLLCVNCSVTNPNSAVDADRTNFSRLNGTVTALQYVEQTLIFPSANANVSCDSVVIRAQLPADLVNLNLLNVIGSISVRTANGTTPNNDATPVDQSLIRLLDDNRTFDIILKPQKNFDRVTVRLGGALNLLSALNVFYAYNSKVDLAATAPQTVTVCKGTSANLSATANTPGATVVWYTQATGGTPVFTGNNFNPTPLINTIYYAETQLGTCVSDTRTPVQVNVADLPLAPVLADATVSVCQNTQAVLSVASPQTGIQYNWYATATGGTILGTGTNFTTPSLSSLTEYYVEAVNAAGCTSATRTKATVTVDATPVNPVLAANSTSVAAGQSTTIAVTNAQTGTVYNWYTSPTALVPVFVGTTYQTPPLLASTTYYVQAVGSAGCLSTARTSITIQVNINTNSPCSFANQQTSDVNNICVGCSVSNGDLAVDADSTTASTIRVTAGLIGGYAEQELRFQQAGIAGDTVKMVIETPVGLTDVNLLAGIRVTYYNGTTAGQGYSLDNALIKLRALPGTNRYAILVPATAAYDRIRIRLNSGAAGLLTSLQVFFAAQEYQKPVFSNANTEICNNSSAQLSITAPATGTFTWFTQPTGGTAVFTGADFTTPNLTANTTYYVEYSRNGCVSPVRYPVQVLVAPQPAKPVLAFDSAMICSGETVALSANAVSNTTIKWYDVATGGTALFTGENFVTPALTANKTYYAEASVGNCVSAERSPVSITVNTAPQDVAATPATQAINAGQTATFTATSSTANTTFNWFASPTGGTSVATGASFTTPPVFANTTYYLDAVSATGCRLAQRIPVSVTVNPVVSTEVPCDAATNQTTDVNALVCVLCSVSNPTGSVDANANTFSQLNVGVGLVNAYAQQTLLFPNIGRAGDSVVLELGVPATLADVGTLSQIQLATYSGNTYNNDRFNVNGSLVNVRLIDGSSRFRIKFPATANFDRVEIRFRSGLAGALSALRVYYAATEVAAPVVTAQTVNTCVGSQATLVATAPDYVTVKWYTTATGGTAVFTGNTFNTPALSANTSYYAEATRTGTSCAQTVRTKVDIIVNPLPVAPVVANNEVTICAGEKATFVATAIPNATISWYATATGGTALFTGNNFTTPALTATTQYYAEAQINGQCTSATRTLVTVNVAQSVDNPTVSQTSVATCSGSAAVLSASSTQSGVTFRWYTSATATTPIFEGAQFTTPSLTQNTSYYVQAALGSCVSADKIKVDVIVNPAPAAPTITVSPVTGQVTSGGSAVLTATSSTNGATIRWYADAQGGTPLFEGAVFTTPNLTNTTTYYAEAFIQGSGCVSVERTAVTITVNPVFSTSCDFALTQNSNVNGICVGCSIQDPNNSVDTDTLNYTRMSVPVGLLGGYATQQLIFNEAGSVGDTVSVLLKFPVGVADVGVLSQIQIGSFNGTTYNNDLTAIGGLASVRLLPGGRSALVRFAPSAAFDRVEVRLNSGLAALLTSLDIYYASKQVEQPQFTDLNVEVCAGGTATFAVANARTGVVYEWYDAPTGGNLVFSGTTFTTPALTATTTYYVQSRRVANDCPNPNRVAVKAVVNPLPPVPVVAQNAFTICPGESVSMSVSNAGTSTVKWYDAATGGTLVFTGATFQTPALIASANYYAEISTATCTSPSRTLVTVTVNDAPAKPTPVLASVQICGGSAAVLAVANPETGVSYDWFTAPTGGTAVFTGINFTTPAITQNTTYYIQARNTTGNCINTGGRTSVNVTVNDQLDVPTLSATTSQLCSGGSISISVNNPQNGILYNWYTSTTGGTPVFTGTTFTTPALTSSTTYYVEAANGSGCVSASRAQTTINIIPVPDAPQIEVAGGSTSVCSGSPATISIINPQNNQVYRWYTAATGGAAIFTGIRFTTPNLSATTTYYVEAASAGNCNPSARTAVTITVNPLPDTPVPAAAVVTVCAGSTASLSVSSPQTGVTYRWYDSADRSNKVFEGSTFVTGAILADQNFYVDAVNASGCANTDLVTVQVKVSPAPATPLLVNNAVAACNGSSVTLSVANPQTGFTYNWYASTTSTEVLFTGTTFTTPVLTSSTTYYVSAVNAGGCSSASRAKVDVTVTPAPVAPTVSANGSTTICPGKTATFTASSSGTGVVYKWYAEATGGTALFTGTTFTTPVLTTSTTYYVEAVNNASGCASSSRSTAEVIVQPGATAEQPQIAQTGLSVCQGNSTSISVNNPQTGVTYNWYASATGGTAIFTGVTFTTPVLTTSTNYYVEATSTQACAPSARTLAAVTVSATPQTPAAENAVVNVCAGSTATLNVASPESGVTYRWYDSAQKTNLLFEGNTYVTGPISSDKNFYLEAVSSGGCAQPNLATVQVKVAPAPGAPVLVSNTASVCQNDRAVLTVANPETGVTYNWYATINGTSPVFTGTSFTTPQITANTSYYVEAVRGTSCASASRTTALVTLKPAPAAPAVTGNGAPICAGSTLVLTASGTEAGTLFKWYASATSTTVLFTGETFTTPALTSTTTYYVEAASSTGSCVSSIRTPVAVTVTPKLAAPVLRILNTTSSTVVFGWDAVSGAAGYEVSTNNGATFSTPSTGANGLSHTVTGLQPGQQVNLIVRAKGATDCQTSANSVAVTGTAQNVNNRVFVPNAFTPNGDGNNDMLMVFGPDIKSLTFRVYNQWGQLYFISTQQSLGWDGTYKGVKQPVGVYVYYLDGVLNNGEPVKMKGTITLLR